MPHKFSPTPLFRNVIVTDGGTLQINSTGNDKNIQIYHDDTNSIFKTSSGALYLQPGNNTIYGYDGSATYAFALYSGAALGVMLHGGANCYINNGNNFGVGTDSPRHRVSIYGTGSSSSAGPHFWQQTDDDAYPQVNLISYTHDDITLAFDYYMDPTTGFLLSSDAGSNFGIKKSSDTLSIVRMSGISAGSLTTPTDAWTMTVDGEVTKPLQPAFLAHPASTQSNFAINTTVTVVLGTERFDQGNDFASNTFTAPVDGKYSLNVSVQFGPSIDSAANQYLLRIVTSNKSYDAYWDPGQLAGDPATWYQSLSVIADMDASDTAYVIVYQNGGSAQTDIYEQTYFSGALIC